MRSVRLFLLPAILSAGLAGRGGSGDNLPRQPVSGSVTLDGRPLAQGMITFEPVDLASGHPATGTIAEGAFEIGRDAGPTPGNYLVRITAAAPDAQLSAAEAMEQGAVSSREDDFRSPIPSRYNAQTELRAQVSEGGPYEFDFSLQDS